MFSLLLNKQKDTFVGTNYQWTVIYLLYIKLLTLSINAGKHVKRKMLFTKFQFIYG